MALQLPGLPVEEQMVDNWGQPTPFMQLRWQEMTEKLALQEASQDDTIGQLAGVVADLDSQGATLAGTVASLSAAVSRLNSVVSHLAAVKTYQDGVNGWTGKVLLNMIQLYITLAGQTTPLSPPVSSTGYPVPWSSIGDLPTPPTPPT